MNADLDRKLNVDNFNSKNRYKVNNLDINQQLVNDPKLIGDKTENINYRKDNVLKSKNKKELISITDGNGNI